MTKREQQRLAQQKEQAENEFVQRIETNTEDAWFCGIRCSDRPDKIWGRASSEQEALRYMEIKLDRNGGFYPVRFMVEKLGVWECDK